MMFAMSPPTMSPPAAARHRTPPEARHRKPTEVRRAELADAALRILARQGARRFTARALARELGITDGAVFRHVPSMDAVLDLVVERMAATLGADLPAPGGDALERVG